MGSPPDLFHPPVGCGYFARCPYAMKSCEKQLPPEYLITQNSAHQARCWLQHKDAPRVKPLFQAGDSDAG
jgi:oligopeptide/dipeptide ABC transporter ATP-binding protein